MKKLVRTSLTNSPSRRGTKDLNVQFYSHDKNNAGFEFVVKNEIDLSKYQAKALFKFRESNSEWETNGTIEGNVVKINFNTDLIARCEEVLGFLVLDSESDSLDIFKFKFNVVLSEFDKNESAKRKFKHIENIEAFDLITRKELKEELSKIQINGGVDLSEYLRSSVAEKTYAKKTDIPTSYDDSAILERVAALENNQSTRESVNIENLATKDQIKNFVTKEQLEKVTKIDYSKIVTVEKLEEKHYISSEKAEEIYLKKNDLPAPIDTTKLVTVDNLKEKNYVPKNELNTLIPNQTLTINNNILTISGGNSVVLPDNKPFTGSGSPDGKVVASPGDMYVNKNVTLGDYLYYKERNPGGVTGWKVLYGSMSVNINLSTGGRIRFSRENYFVSASISDLTISLDALKSGQARDFYQDGENVVIRFIPAKQFDARESIIPQGYRPSGNFLVPAYSKSGDSIGLFRFEQVYGIIKLILNDITLANVTSEMLTKINSGLIVYPTPEAWMTKLP